MQSIINKGMMRMVAAVQELSLARDLNTVMAIVRTVARELTGADGATFVLREGDFCFYADEDAISPLWKGSRFPMHTCISGWSMLNKQAAFIEDIYTDERIPVEAYKPTFVKSLAMVPIRTIEPIGAIGNYWARRHKPTDEEIMLLQALADITAVTIENVRIYNELDERVKQRTVELQATIQELEAFSYSVSHDLRAPLRAIRGYMDMLREDHGSELSPKAQLLAGKVINNAEKMSRLIEDLLGFFRMGRKELTRQGVAMQALVTEICSELKEAEKNRKIEFIIREMPDGLGDPTLVRQVWVNLVSNAVKYTGGKEQAIVEIGCSNTEGGSVTYYVKDNGAGFDMQYYNKLFGVFQRLHSADEFEGLGIGLATAARIVNKHGGKIWAVGKPGEGAAFYFSLA